MVLLFLPILSGEKARLGCRRADGWGWRGWCWALPCQPRPGLQVGCCSAVWILLQGLPVAAWLLEVAQGGTLEARAGASLCSPSEPAMATAGVLWARRGNSRPLVLSLAGSSAARGQEPLFLVAGWHLCLLEGVSRVQRGSGWTDPVEAGRGAAVLLASCCSRAAAALQTLRKDGVSSGCYFRLGAPPPPPGSFCFPLGRKLCLPARLRLRPSGAAETTGVVGVVSGWQDPAPPHLCCCSLQEGRWAACLRDTRQGQAWGWGSILVGRGARRK